MSAVQIASARPWYARRWLAWPVGWQVASMAALVALVFSAVAGLSELQEELVTAVLVGIRRTVPAGPGLIELARAAYSDAIIGSWSLVDVTAGVLVPLFLTMLAASTVLGAALCRVARGGAFQ